MPATLYWYSAALAEAGVVETRESNKEEIVVAFEILFVVKLFHLHGTGYVLLAPDAVGGGGRRS